VELAAAGWQPDAIVRAAAGAQRLLWKGRSRLRQCLVMPITPVIAAHAGIGAWGVFSQNEDGTNAETVRYD
jgi:fatty acid-binding protein DegV